MRCPSFEESMSSIVGNLKNDLPGDSPTGAVPSAVGFYFAFRTMAVLVSVRIFGAEPQTGTGINIVVDYSPFAYDCILLSGQHSLSIQTNCEIARCPVGIAFPRILLLQPTMEQHSVPHQFNCVLVRNDRGFLDCRYAASHWAAHRSLRLLNEWLYMGRMHGGSRCVAYARTIRPASRR